eukprot:CAMPEP_0198697430 /NCGR_PEP_ID=MMETSP1468-20131203/322438_1 /TAXON_ID=1461545 /ORGANISM="Mantoniella sp, Strain CCMP1436" /LENGTH=194 /DNA_ID=CAMNT_0044454103 /DNA_START=130 /DNA_END=714 /DNA_ORIENTATION=+
MSSTVELIYSTSAFSPMPVTAAAPAATSSAASSICSLSYLDRASWMLPVSVWRCVSSSFVHSLAVSDLITGLLSKYLRIDAVRSSSRRFALCNISSTVKLMCSTSSFSPRPVPAAPPRTACFAAICSFSYFNRGMWMYLMSFWDCVSSASMLILDISDMILGLRSKDLRIKSMRWFVMQILLLSFSSFLFTLRW